MTLLASSPEPFYCGLSYDINHTVTSAQWRTCWNWGVQNYLTKPTINGPHGSGGFSVGLITVAVVVIVIFMLRRRRMAIR